MEATIVASAAIAPQSDVGVTAAPPADIASGIIQPVPMSFPAVLRTSGVSDRFAHLRTGSNVTSTDSAPVAPKKSKRDEKDGKRWARRKDNARFVGNPHIVVASQKDYSILPPTHRSAFPEPLPAYLSRNNPVPPAVPAAREPNSANAGRFSMSLKGMRKELRKSGPMTEQLVKEVEAEIVGWLKNGGVLVNPDIDNQYDGIQLPGTPVGTQEGIREVSRTPLQLVWSISDNAFTRYVVHCCARYHNVVSFSKDASGQRLTYLLRPNVTRPDFAAPASLETPPATESELSAFECASESDFVSDTHSEAGVDSEGEGLPPYQQQPEATSTTSRGIALSDIAESTPNSPAFPAAPPPHDLDDSWSIISGDDSDRDGGDEFDLASSVGSLSVQDNINSSTPTPIRSNDSNNDLVTRAQPRRLIHTPLRTSLWERHRRSASSPSRSPARRTLPRVYPRIEPPKLKPSTRSFYDYLFA